MTSYLKPCPFCGSDAKYAKRENRNLSGWSHEIDHWVFCDGDDCLVHMGMGETKDEVVHMWNTRADLAAPGWQSIETAPKDQWILLGYTQQGDEMPTGLMVGVGMYCKSGKIWTMNAMDNEKAWPSHWKPLPKPPLTKEN